MKTVMKKLLCICAVLLVFGILFPRLSTAVNAMEQADQAGEEITWTFQEESGVLTINGTGKILDCCDFLGYYPPWEEWDAAIKEIVVSEGITAIGQDVFNGCINLTRVSLPSTLVSIRDRAFYYCTSLRSITIPKTVTEIGAEVFRGCGDLTEILVDGENPRFVSNKGVLYNKTMTELLACPGGFTGEFMVPQGVRILREDCFNSCEKLTKVIIPEGVTEIQDRAFIYCTGLTEMRIPDSVKTIGYAVFAYCSSLKNVDLNKASCDSLTDTFEWCADLEKLTVSEKHPSYKQDDQGAVYNKEMTQLIFCPAGYSGDFVIPNGVKLIENSAFFGCASIKNVWIPGSVDIIADCAFWYCSSLEHITIPHGVKTIGSSAFEGCESLKTVSIPDSVSCLGEEVFEDCAGLTRVFLSGEIKELGSGIFQDCISLRDVYFRDGAPSAEELEECWYIHDNRGTTLYYIEGQDGWTTPTLNGFAT